MLPFIVVGVILIIRAFDDCYSIEGLDGTTEVVCPPGARDDGLLAAGIVILAVGFIAVWVFFIRMLAKSGQTWGRRITNVRVVRAADGESPGWGRAIGRVLFAGIVSGQCCYLGYLWMLWDGENRTWHDMVAGTRVIKV